jgi:tetratricopeptide (TPR) repeat protein
MRGLKISVGFLLVMTAILAMPSSLRAQGATSAQYLAAGNQSYTAKNYTQAIQYYSVVMKSNPNYAPIYQSIGNCYYALGNKAYALAYYKRASALQPNNTQLAQFVQNLQAQVNAGAAAPTAATADPLSQGTALFQQKQYSIKAYGDRIKASLSPDDQAWVDDQVSKYSQGGGAMAGGSKGGKKKDVAFGFHILGGEELVLSNKTQIEQYAPASMAVTGVAPTMLMAFGVEPYLQFGESFEVNLAFNYLPVGGLSYKTYEIRF